MFDEFTHVDFVNKFPIIKIPLSYNVSNCYNHVHDVKITGISDGKIFAIENLTGERVKNIKFKSLPIADKIEILDIIESQF